MSNLATLNTADSLSGISTRQIEESLERANDAYRNTDDSIISDSDYDALIDELARRDPGHALLTEVESEADFGAGKVRHQIPMLSTEKVKTDSELSAWVRRVESAAQNIGIRTPVLLSVTAKLDGMAGRLKDGVLASRGDGLTGNNITHILPKLVVHGVGDGELVMIQSYFDEHLSEEFKHPRNVVTGAVGADTPRPAAMKALNDHSIHFVSFTTLTRIDSRTDTIVAQLPEIREYLLGNTPYPTDGLVLAVESPELRKELGSTGHHHNWMVAAKTVGETATTAVVGVQWQIGKTGRLTPVIQLKKVTLSGAVIANVTGHNAGKVEEMGIDVGAMATITRSGEIIPFLVSATPAPNGASLPTHCPACTEHLKRRGDFLVCINNECEGRRHARLHHFFNIIGSIDLFGPVACDKLIAAGVRSIQEVFAITAAEFEAMGFGPGQSANLVAELEAAKTRPVDDFRVLAAMGISNLGRGDSKKLLRHTALKDIPF
ncbi:hypothetical protein, partial [Marinobacter sp. ELB17]|uniref:hypothetical protein n=1 Tax=Marinobacter sp. ELB17 TaxID=270374 RepID=UPI0000F37225